MDISVNYPDSFKVNSSCKKPRMKNYVGIVLPELQRFYGRAIVIITPVEMPIRHINRPLSIIIFVLYLSVYRVVLGRIYD
jgi:hypothetical protein